MRYVTLDTHMPNFQHLYGNRKVFPAIIWQQVTRIRKVETDITATSPSVGIVSLVDSGFVLPTYIFDQAHCVTSLSS